jgi:hypothetical protein
VGLPKVDLSKIVDRKENSSVSFVGLDREGIPAANIRFSLLYNDIASPLLAAGACTGYPSFLHKMRIRTTDVKYNIEQGFYAAMNMMDKQVEFNYFHLYQLKIGNTTLYYVGEPQNAYTEVITKGDPKTGKFVTFYVYGNEIVGFVTCGYSKLHLYLWEAMKQLIMPTAKQMREADGDFESIVAGVLQMAPAVTANRKITLQNPSVYRAEFDHEIDQLALLKSKLNLNIELANAKQRERLE